MDLPADLQCLCVYYDQCFEDEHRQFNGLPEERFCFGYPCVECDYDTGCPKGDVRDRCHRQ